MQRETLEEKWCENVSVFARYFLLSFISLLKSGIYLAQSSKVVTYFYIFQSLHFAFFVLTLSFTRAVFRFLCNMNWELSIYDIRFNMCACGKYCQQLNEGWINHSVRCLCMYVCMYVWVCTYWFFCMVAVCNEIVYCGFYFNLWIWWTRIATLSKSLEIIRKLMIDSATLMEQSFSFCRSPKADDSNSLTLKTKPHWKNANSVVFFPFNFTAKDTTNKDGMNFKLASEL